VVKTTQSQADTPSPSRLVIRVKIPVEEPPPPARQPLHKGVLLLVLAALAVGALSWFGISLYREEPTSPAPVPVPSASAPVVSEEVPQTAPEAEPKVQQAPSAPPTSSTNEVIPDVPKSARDTIRGTIRVSIRAIVDKDGNVVATTVDESGPSRYFARLSVEAAKKWTFAPSASEEQRVMMVRFYFKRSGTTGRAIPVQ
jgi:TonB family protein